MINENIMQTIEAATVFGIYKAGQEDERAKIVAWIRSEFALDWVCECIEEGKHLK